MRFSVGAFLLAVHGASALSSNYLDAFSPKSNAPAKSYGFSSFKPGQAAPKGSGFADQVGSGSGAAPVAPMASASHDDSSNSGPVSTGNYMDAISPKSNVPPKSYGFSSFKPGQKAPSSPSTAGFAPVAATSSSPAAPAASEQQQAASSGGYMDAISPKSNAPAKSYGFSSFKPGQAVPKSMGFADQVASTTASAPAAPAQQAVNSGGYLDAFSPKSNAPAKSYGLSSFKPGQTVPQTMGFANSQVGSGAATAATPSNSYAPAAPAAAAHSVPETQAVSSGGYMDAISPRSNAPTKSYGLSSFKPGQAVPKTNGFADHVASSPAASYDYAPAPEAPATPSSVVGSPAASVQAQAVSTENYMDAISPQSNAPTKSYGISSFKPGQAAPKLATSYLDIVASAQSISSQDYSAPSAPQVVDTVAATTGTYLDSVAPKSTAPSKSYSPFAPHAPAKVAAGGIPGAQRFDPPPAAPAKTYSPFAPASPLVQAPAVTGAPQHDNLAPVGSTITQSAPFAPTAPSLPSAEVTGTPQFDNSAPVGSTVTQSAPFAPTAPSLPSEQVSGTPQFESRAPVGSMVTQSGPFAPVAPSAPAGGATASFSSGGGVGVSSGTGNYIDALTPKSRAPAKSYGPSSYKPGKAAANAKKGIPSYADSVASQNQGSRSSGSNVRYGPAGTNAASVQNVSPFAPPTPIKPASPVTGAPQYDSSSPVGSTVTQSAPFAPSAPSLPSREVTGTPQFDSSAPVGSMVTQSAPFAPTAPSLPSEQVRGTPQFESKPAASTSITQSGPFAPVAPSSPAGGATASYSAVSAPSSGTGNYMDALSPAASRAPSKSYGPSSFKPGGSTSSSGVGFGNSYLNSVGQAGSYASLSTAASIAQVSKMDLASRDTDYAAVRTMGSKKRASNFNPDDRSRVSNLDLALDRRNPPTVGQPSVAVGGNAFQAGFGKDGRTGGRPEAGKLMQPTQAVPQPNYYHGQSEKHGKPAHVQPMQPSVAVSGSAFAAGFRNGAPNGQKPQKGLIAQPGVAFPASNQFHGGAATGAKPQQGLIAQPGVAYPSPNYFHGEADRSQKPAPGKIMQPSVGLSAPNFPPRQGPSAGGKPRLVPGQPGVAPPSGEHFNAVSMGNYLDAVAPQNTAPEPDKSVNFNSYLDVISANRAPAKSYNSNLASFQPQQRQGGSASTTTGGGRSPFYFSGPASSQNGTGSANVQGGQSPFFFSGQPTSQNFGMEQRGNPSPYGPVARESPRQLVAQKVMFGGLEAAQRNDDPRDSVMKSAFYRD